MVVDGVAVFTDRTNRKEITINERTEGVALRRSPNRNGGTDLFLCFDENEIYQLQFSATNVENSLFFLNFTNDPSIDARGKLLYGGKNVNLNFNGATPHLMIKLTEKRAPVRKQREAPGQKVASAVSAALGASEPLTNEIMERLKNTPDFNIGQHQFFLYGAITLEGFDNQKRVSVNNNGEVIFEDSPTTTTITIKDKTAGLAKSMNETTGDIAICFDEDDRYQLVFSPSRRDSRFYLKSNPPNVPDARGSWPYGGNDYNLRFSGGTPYLQISLKKEGGNTTEQRTVPGRKVGN